MKIRQRFTTAWSALHNKIKNFLEFCAKRTFYGSLLSLEKTFKFRCTKTYNLALTLFAGFYSFSPRIAIFLTS